MESHVEHEAKRLLFYVPCETTAAWKEIFQASKLKIKKPGLPGQKKGKMEPGNDPSTWCHGLNPLLSMDGDSRDPETLVN